MFANLVSFCSCDYFREDLVRVNVTSPFSTSRWKHRTFKIFHHFWVLWLLMACLDDFKSYHGNTLTSALFDCCSYAFLFSFTSIVPLSLDIDTRIQASGNKWKEVLWFWPICPDSPLPWRDTGWIQERTRLLKTQSPKLPFSEGGGWVFLTTLEGVGGGVLVLLPISGFPLFRTDKIPWLFQYFLPFSSIFLMFWFFKLKAWSILANNTQFFKYH